MIRAILIVSGKVRKRGFRTIIEEKALEFGVVGTVENMPDGRVKIVCEAEREVVEKFIKSISIRERFIGVKEIEKKFSKPSGEFHDFKVVKGEPLEEIAESTEAGAIYLRALTENMSGLHKEMSGFRNDSEKSFSKLNKNISGFRKDSEKSSAKLNENISGLRTDTSENFGKMDRKYGSISGKMGKFEDVVSELVKTLRQDRTEMKRLTDATITAIKRIR